MLESRFSFAEFYCKRLKRIFPASYVCNIFCVYVSYCVMNPIKYEMIKTASIFGVFSLSNIFNSFYIEEGYFSSDLSSFPLLHLWSLSVEEQFYLIWPLMMLFFARISDGSKIVWLIAIIFASTLSAQLVYHHNQSIAYYMLVNRMGEIMIGALLNFIPLSENHLYNQLMGLIGLILTACSLFLINSNSIFPGFYTLLPCLGASLLIHSNHQQNTITYKLFSFFPLVKVGLVSYSAYLYHWPVLAISNYFEITLNLFNTLNLFLLGTFLTLFSYFLVEKPTRYSTMSKRTSFVVLFVIPVLFLLCFIFFLSSNKMGLERAETNNINTNLLTQQTVPLPSWFKFENYEWYELWGGCPICTKEDEDICFPMWWEERCKEETIIKDVFVDKTERCWRGSSKPSLPNVLFVGDSHQVHFIPIFDLFAKEMGFKYFGYSKGQILPCIFETKDKFLSKIVSKLSEFKVVVIAAMWQRYNYSSCIERTVNKLLEMNKKVMLIGDVPFFQEMKTQCPYQQPPINSLFSWCVESKPLKEFELVLEANQVLQKMSVNQKNLFYWDFNDVLCPLGICKTYYRTVRIYSEDAHLNYGFSELVARDYLENIGIPWNFKALFDFKNSSNFLKTLPSK